MHFSKECYAGISDHIDENGIDAPLVWNKGGQKGLNAQVLQEFEKLCADRKWVNYHPNSTIIVFYIFFRLISRHNIVL